MAPSHHHGPSISEIKKNLSLLLKEVAQPCPYGLTGSTVKHTTTKGVITTSDAVAAILITDKHLRQHKKTPETSFI